MRRLLVWNKDINKYSIKTLTPEEEDKYGYMLDLKERAKYLYNIVMKDAEKAGMPVDLYIDNEAYSTYCVQNNYVSEAEEIAQEFGIEFSIPRLLID